MFYNTKLPNTTFWTELHHIWRGLGVNLLESVRKDYYTYMTKEQKTTHFLFYSIQSDKKTLYYCFFMLTGGESCCSKFINPCFKSLSVLLVRETSILRIQYLLIVLRSDEKFLKDEIKDLTEVVTFSVWYKPFLEWKLTNVYTCVKWN